MSPLETAIYHYLTLGGVAAGIAVFVLLFTISAPYGRHARKGWGPAISSRLGWILMEFPSPTVLLICFLYGQGAPGIAAWVLVAFWLTHYIHRTLVFPFRLRERGKQTPVMVVLMAVLFNVFNGYLNGRYLGVHSGAYGAAWFTDPRFLIGSAMFITGFLINLQSDQILFSLRAPGETGYKIPYGGCYRWISCPNYFGELIEWTGWAVACWSVPGLVFAFWTAANLVPRARSHHQWYRQHFPDYPPQRKAVIPFLF
jgi:3-oxo-5-alpha-steroid 4-dehydrogenase 1